MDIDPRDTEVLKELEDSYGTDWADVATFQDAVAFVEGILGDASAEEYELVQGFLQLRLYI